MRRFKFNKSNPPVNGFLLSLVLSLSLILSLLLISGIPAQATYKTPGFYQPFDNERHLTLASDFLADDDQDSAVFSTMNSVHGLLLEAAVFLALKCNNNEKKPYLTQAIRGPPIDNQLRCYTSN